VLGVAVLGGLILLITAITDEVKWGLVAAILVVGAAVVVLIGFIRRIATVYTITNQRLHIKRGIVSRKIQQTRIERVQNVNISQSVIQRILQVGKVDFDTAGTDDADFAFDGVSQPENILKAVEQAQHEAAQAPSDGLGDPAPQAAPPPPPPAAGA
jgi:uncharacterized membrane protein YdbT with pleckstrin-like domain